MKGPAAALWACAVVCLSLAVQSSRLGAGPGREFVLTFRPVESARYYEIQFLEQVPAGESPPTGQIERFTGTSYRQMIPPEFRFFRIRAVAERDIPGLWSAAHPVDRYLKAASQVFLPVKTGEGQNQTLYLVNQSLSLRSSDQGVGQARIFYSLNGSPYAEYRSPLTFDEDGAYTLQWYGVDGVGNQEAPQSAGFYVDRTAPTTTLAFRVPLVMAHGRLFTAPANAFSIRTSDALSGVAGTYCRLLVGSGGAMPAFAPCMASFALEDFAPRPGGGIYVLEYFSEDRVGNRSALYRVEIRRPEGRQVALIPLRNMGLPAPAL